MATAEPGIDDPEALKREWVGRLEALVRDIRSWVEASGWKTRVYRKSMREDPALGQYEAPRLVMERERDGVTVALDPVARYVPGADGGVDLYRMPGYDDVASLHHEGGQWVVHHARRPDPAANPPVGEGETLPYSRETILAVLDAMAGDDA
jgi:hypothetical protein